MPSSPYIDKAIPWVEQRTNLVLADSQKAALRVALLSNVTVITGGPGVGKTTLVNSLLKILTAKAVTISLWPRQVALQSACPRAPALKQRQSIGCWTDPRTATFRRNEDEPLDLD